MNRQEIRTRILESLNESASSPVFFSIAQIDEAINEGMEILAEEANAIKRTAFTALRPATTYYYTQGIATDMMAPYRIWLTHLDRRLVAISMADLDARRERWIRTSGDPEYWFSISWNLFGIYPAPASGGGVMRIDYLAWPRPMLDDSDEPEFLLADRDSLVLYGVYDGLLKMLDFSRAMLVFSEFIDLLSNAMVRHGLAKMDARTFQLPSAEGTGFRGKITR